MICKDLLRRIRNDLPMPITIAALGLVTHALGRMLGDVGRYGNFFVAAIFFVWMLRKHGEQRLFAWSLALILGGAVGNVIDRLIHGHVIDFLDFHWRGWHWPAFNIADSAIVCGAALLILDELLRVRKSR